MTVFATVPVNIHVTKPKPGDAVLGEAEALVDGRRGRIVLTTRGLYLVMEREESGWGIDLNALARAMADAVAPPMRPEGGRNG